MLTKYFHQSLVELLPTFYKWELTLKMCKIISKLTNNLLNQQQNLFIILSNIFQKIYLVTEWVYGMLTNQFECTVFSYKLIIQNLTPQ